MKLLPSWELTYSPWKVDGNSFLEAIYILSPEHLKLSHQDLLKGHLTQYLVQTLWHNDSVHLFNTTDGDLRFMSHALSKKKSTSLYQEKFLWSFMLSIGIGHKWTFLSFPPFTLIFWGSTSTQKVWNNYFRQRLPPVTTSSHWWQAGVVYRVEAWCTSNLKESHPFWRQTTRQIFRCQVLAVETTPNFWIFGWV